jgi:hypothetical protein
MDSQMKLLVVVAYLACLPLAHASPETDACDTRREALEQQMATALNQDGSAQLDSLQAQLDKTNAECAPDAIAKRHADAQKRHDDAIADARGRLRDYDAELARAQKKGTDKLNIAAWERKVHRAQADLDHALASPVQ